MAMTEDTIQLRRAVTAVNEILFRRIQETDRKVRDQERRIERLEEEMDTARALIAQQIKLNLERPRA